MGCRRDFYCYSYHINWNVITRMITWEFQLFVCSGLFYFRFFLLMGSNWPFFFFWTLFNFRTFYTAFGLHVRELMRIKIDLKFRSSWNRLWKYLFQNIRTQFFYKNYSADEKDLKMKIAKIAYTFRATIESVRSRQSSSDWVKTSNTVILSQN